MSGKHKKDFAGLIAELMAALDASSADLRRIEGERHAAFGALYALADTLRPTNPEVADQITRVRELNGSRREACERVAYWQIKIDRTIADREIGSWKVPLAPKAEG